MAMKRLNFWQHIFNILPTDSSVSVLKASSTSAYHNIFFFNMYFIVSKLRSISFLLWE